MNRRLIELLPAGEDGGPHPWMRPRVAVILLLSALIFVIDTFTGLASAVAVLYALVLMVAGDGLPRRGVMAVAAACMALTAVSYSLNHGLQLEPSALLRFLFSLAAISVTAAVTALRPNPIRRKLLTSAICKFLEKEARVAGPCNPISPAGRSRRRARSASCAG